MGCCGESVVVQWMQRALPEDQLGQHSRHAAPMRAGHRVAEQQGMSHAQCACALVHMRMCIRVVLARDLALYSSVAHR